MTFRLILFGILSLTTAFSHESDSAEVNKVDMPPFYDTIVFGDVQEVINELENNVVSEKVSPLDILLGSGSESEETIEDLLSEYQHYLDKAHKQRLNYIEKNKIKNKVPGKRHDRYSKLKPAGELKFDDYYYTNSYSNNKYMPITYSNPVDVIVPMNPKFTYFNNNLNSIQPKDNQELTYDKRILDLPPVMPKPVSRYEPIKSSCYCKNGQFPCECNCKQCLMPIDSVQPNVITHNLDAKGLLTNVDYASEDKLRDMSDNTLNVRIKVDIQIPKMLETLGKSYKNRSHDDITMSRESTVSLPFPSFNFPIPIDLFGYKRSSKFNNHDSHKITIHKKKKSRINSGNKKHRKKVITFHNVNIQPQQPKIQPFFDDFYNNSVQHEKFIENTNVTIIQNTTIVVSNKTEENVTHPDVLYHTESVNSTAPTLVNNETQTEENIYVRLNISSGGDNITEDAHKIENSVETEYTKSPILNIPTEKQLILRRKRETANELPTKPPVLKNMLNVKKTSDSNLSLNTKPTSELDINAKKILMKQSATYNSKLKLDDTKKSDKTLFADTELTYWPNDHVYQMVISPKNITTLILDRENKKAKLNVTKDTLRNDHTKALEKAIFGDANWDDVDTVAPVFLSFVGKYLRGVLSFCSQNVCHSMKCADKTCVHRTCAPNDRWNHKGHCAGSNGTDSIASLESILDLPSNVAFEIVDILQDKMLGKLFGKVTLCISSKCISFVACKKNFLKSRCSVKDLKNGHCPNIKNFKIM